MKFECETAFECTFQIVTGIGAGLIAVIVLAAIFGITFWKGE